MRVANQERDLEIYRKREVEKWDFRRIAKFFNMSVSTIHDAHRRVKNKGGSVNVELSTV